MGGALQLAYPVRGQISHAVGLALVLSLWLLLGFRSEFRPEPRLLEFQADLAVLEAPLQPTVQEQPSPEPVKPAEHQPAPAPATVVHAATVPQPVPVVNAPASTLSESTTEAPATLAAVSPPPAAVGPGGTATAGDSAAAATAANASARAAYEATLRAYLERIKRYPSSREARQTRPRGVVRVWLDLDRSGRLLDSGVLNGSGSNLLDGEALRTIRGGAYPSFSDHEYQGEDRRRFTAALSYTIE